MTTPTEFVGTLPNPGDVYGIGDPDAWQSVVLLPATTNLIANPQPVLSLAGYVGISASLQRVQQGARLTKRDRLPTWVTLATSNGASTFGASFVGIPAFPGLPYSGSAALVAVTGPFVGQVSLEFDDANGTALTTVAGTAVPLAQGALVRASVTSFAPPNSATVRIVWTASGAAAPVQGQPASTQATWTQTMASYPTWGSVSGQTWTQADTAMAIPAGAQMMIEDPQVEQSPVPSVYIDGDEPNGRWDGTPYASTSSRLQSPSEFTQLIYATLPRIYRAQDPGTNWATLRLLSSILDVASYSAQLVERFDFTGPSEPGGSASNTSDLVDPRTADDAWLPFIAQAVGVDHLPSDDQGKRDAIATPSAGWQAGTSLSVAAAAQSALTGTRYVRVVPHSDANGAAGPWDLLLITRASETPNGTQSVLDAVNNKHAKPAGVALHASLYQPTWGQVTSAYGSWGSMAGMNWLQIEETGSTTSGGQTLGG